jgi:hypothetical protein
MEWYWWAGIILFGFGGIEWIQAYAAAILERITGKPQTLSKRKVRRLQAEHTEALDILREIDAYDRFAENPLPTEVHQRLRHYLDSKAGRTPLPTKEETR